MPKERPYATLYFLAVAMFAISVAVCKMLLIEMSHVRDPDAYLPLEWAKVKCEYDNRRAI